MRLCREGAGSNRAAVDRRFQMRLFRRPFVDGDWLKVGRGGKRVNRFGAPFGRKPHQAILRSYVLRGELLPARRRLAALEKV